MWMVWENMLLAQVWQLRQEAAQGTLVLQDSKNKEKKYLTLCKFQFLLDSINFDDGSLQVDRTWVDALCKEG